MTRYLSQALGAEEPFFSQNITALEKAGGLPSADIRLTAWIMRLTREKIMQLGLDPNDTTPEELYNSLLLKLSKDDYLLRNLLHISTDLEPRDVVQNVTKFLNKMKIQKNCFLLKHTVARRMLKQKPPRHVMKMLGYRSLDSMLKRESPELIYAAAIIGESPQWHKQFREAYVKLKPGDFEIRNISFISPKTKYWLKLSNEFTSNSKHNIICLRELGAIIILPIYEQIDGLAITTLLISLEFINDIRSQSSFAKLQQVKPDFGRLMQQSSIYEPLANAKVAGQNLSWRMIQRYYGQNKPEYNTEVFEPHVQEDDLLWSNSAEELAKLQPELAFWENTDFLFLLNEGKPVSLNMLDVALSFCNHLTFADRVVKYMRSNLWHELVSRYINQSNLENVLSKQLSDNMAEESTLAE